MGEPDGENEEQGSALTAVSLRPAALSDKPTLIALMQLYLHDSSVYTRQDVNSHGQFDYYYLDFYWTEEGRRPFLVYAGDQLAGLVLIRTLETGDDPLYQLAEFFILRKYRRQNIGRTAAMAAFDRFPGRWEVQQEAGNLAGQAFWRRVIAEYTGDEYQESWLESKQHRGPVQTFRSPEIGR